MNITVEWFDIDSPRKRILMEFTDTWTWDEFHAACHKMHHLIASVEDKVDVIICHHVDYPSGSILQHLQRVMRDQPTNTGKVVIVPFNQPYALTSFFGTLARIFERMFPISGKVIQARSLEEAHALLADSKV